ncbi:MAG: PAS domain S-box protein [Deltaproteobacteria bacterium]|nr:PAS domain S-box protein [Deltaproteobacteria bacterium]
MPVKSPRPRRTVRRKRTAALKIAEQLRHASERFAQSTLDALSAHIAILDETGSIIAVNRTWRDFAKENHSQPSTVCEGANYFSVCDAARGDGAEQAAMFAAAVRRILRGEQGEFSLEYPCHSPDEKRWFNVHVTRFTSAGAARVVVAHEAITDRMLAEESGRHSEELYRAVVEDQTELITRFKADGTFTFVNPVYSRYVGKTRDELIGNRWQPYAYLDDVPVIEERLAAMSPDNPVVVIENRVYCASGEICWFQFVNRGFFDKNGHLVETQSVGRDITELKKTTEALRESEERFRSLINSSLDAVLLTVPDGRILAANEAACRMFGRSEEELVRIGRDGVVDASDPRLTPGLEERVRTGRFRGELTFVRKDGTKFPGELSSAVFAARNGQLLNSTVIRDIGKRKQAEQELRASREQLRAMASHCQTAREEERTNVAREIHDVLAQELTRLKIDLAWIERDFAPHKKVITPEALLGRVSDMRHSVDSAIDCVKKIATELRPAVLDSLGLCATVEWQAREFQSRTGIHCLAHVPAEEMVKKRDTATAIFRILQETLTNVSRHSKATLVNILLQAENGHLLLRVRDNGRGISSNSINNPMSIGLAGMRERAQLLGGYFEIQGRPGFGTTIEVRIPLQGNENARGGAP